MANTMYPAKVNSPKTELAATIAADATTIAVVDVTKLPAAPNLCTILNGDDSETFSYATISGNNLTGCVRGLNGTAKAWTVGMKVARTYTAYDHDTFIEQINEIVSKLVAASTTKAGLVQLSDAISSTATDRAATANAVKRAYDQAGTAETNAKNASYPKTGGAINGSAQVVSNGAMFALVGTDHGYVEFFPKGTAAGRKAYLGFPNVNDSANFGFVNQETNGEFFLSDKNGVVTTGQLRGLYIGTGQPNGAISAPLGSLYRNLAGGATATLWVKEGGAAGNSGWVAK